MKVIALLFITMFSANSFAFTLYYSKLSGENPILTANECFRIQIEHSKKIKIFQKISKNNSKNMETFCNSLNIYTSSEIDLKLKSHDVALKKYIDSQISENMGDIHNAVNSIQSNILNNETVKLIKESVISELKEEIKQLKDEIERLKLRR